jgi:hypothetical protein
MGLDDSPAPRPSSGKGIDLGPEDQGHVQQPSSPTGPDPNLNSDRWVSLDDLYHPATQKDVGLAPEHQQQPSTVSPTGFDLDPPPYPLAPIRVDNDYYVDLPSSPTESYSYSYPGAVAHSPPSGAGSPTVPEFKASGSPTVPEDEVVPGPPPSPSTDPELHLDHPSSSADLPAADSQPPSPDLLASIYTAKGKAKVSRRVSSPARDAGNAAQRELQSAGRSLDPGE